MLILCLGYGCYAVGAETILMTFAVDPFVEAGRKTIIILHFLGECVRCDNTSLTDNLCSEVISN